MGEERMNRRGLPGWTWLGFALAVAGAIFYGSLFRKPGNGGVEHLDKVLHFAAYALLTLALCAGVNGARGARALRSAMPLCVGMATLYGVSLEFAQEWFVAERAFDLGDIAADFLGGVCAASAWVLLATRAAASGRTDSDKKVENGGDARHDADGHPEKFNRGEGDCARGVFADGGDDDGYDGARKQ